MLLPLAALVVAYFCGSIPFGVLFARARGVDLQKVGSGNIGATNAARALGRPLGVAVFVCDAAKGLLPVLAARLWLAPHLTYGAWWVPAIGVAAFLGHLAPIWLGGRGGKGVATGFGVFAALALYPALIAGGVFLLTYALTRISSLGSLLGTTLFLPALWLLGGDLPTLVAGGAMWVLIVFKHRGNIARLIKREEHRV